MYKLVVLAVVLATAQAGHIAAPYAGLPLGYAAGLPLGYAGAPLGYAGAPLGYAGAAPLAAAPLAYAAAPIHAHAYALPAVRDVVEAPLIHTHVEKVEQHGYKIAY